MSDEQIDPDVELFSSLLEEYGTTVTDWFKSPIKELVMPASAVWNDTWIRRWIAAQNPGYSWV